MEMEQILKQVDWLDEERRKDKNKLGSLEERLGGLEEKITPLGSQVKDLAGEITRLNVLITRMENIDASLLQLRVENKQNLENLEKGQKKREDDIEKLLRAEIRSLENALAETNKQLDQLPEIKRSLHARMEEETRLARLIDDVRNKIEGVRRSEEEYNRTIRLVDDGRRQDSKRLTDLQGEVATMRKRLDDQRGKLDLNSTTLKKVETHVNELAAVETERREAVSTFLENQAMREVERERVWKEWQARFEIIETQATDIENTLQSLDATQRAVKRSQQTVEELSQKVERRINEITEIQRLAEERFRQEWVTFKADDQKRWTNYTLTMEEQHNESQRQHERLSEKVTHLEDEVQEIQDLISQSNEHAEKRLQSLLAMAHDWVSSYERTVGRSR
jgi:DNA repair exonuclease SbcCD ATPase subunit